MTFLWARGQHHNWTPISERAHTFVVRYVLTEYHSLHEGACYGPAQRELLHESSKRVADCPFSFTAKVP